MTDKGYDRPSETAYYSCSLDSLPVALKYQKGQQLHQHSHSTRLTTRVKGLTETAHISSRG